MQHVKQKIINDPVHGFITIPPNLVFRLFEHPYLQRLRNIKQLGLTYLVYPGACHSRFLHALGAMHLMSEAIETLRLKGVEVSEEEHEAAACAILLHDIGHGPFSHTLEHSIVDGVDHEEISLAMMSELNRQLDGRLSMAIAIFTGDHPKQFLHQLVSSQLDVDRLDYLSRDSFFSGVAEGMIGLQRIIKMLNVRGNELVIEAKGIYSIEKFLISRHLMYWQVYLHKTVVAAERLLISIIERAKLLVRNGEQLFASPSLAYFLKDGVRADCFTCKDSTGQSPMEHFARLSDSDIDSAIVVWSTHPDKVLSTLCCMLLARKLLKVEMANQAFPIERVEQERIRAAQQMGLTGDEVDYFVASMSVQNKTYTKTGKPIKVLYNHGRVVEIMEASDILNTIDFADVKQKHILCYPKLGV